MGNINWEHLQDGRVCAKGCFSPGLALGHGSGSLLLLCIPLAPTRLLTPPPPPASRLTLQPT
jgi:hypothetical protein